MKNYRILIGILVLSLLAVFVYNLPPIHERLAWRVDNLRVTIQRYFNPPEEVVFSPQQQIDVIVQATLSALTHLPTTGTTPPSLTETPLPIPSTLPTAIPERAA